MSITDELRRVAVKTETASGRCERLYRGDLERLANAIEAELAERYVALPLDAEGEPIHAGDMLDGYGKTIEVVEIRHGRSGWVLISRDGNGYADTFAFTHHHKPTVEDVLKDFIDAWAEWKDGAAMMNPVETFAAKLRLASDDE